MADAKPLTAEEEAEVRKAWSIATNPGPYQVEYAYIVATTQVVGDLLALLDAERARHAEELARKDAALREVREFLVDCADADRMRNKAVLMGPRAMIGVVREAQEKLAAIDAALSPQDGAGRKVEG